MSVITSKTGLTSILKEYTSAQRDKAKNAAVNKVRFDMPKLKSFLEVVRGVREEENYQLMSEFVEFLKQIELTNDEFINIFIDARKVSTQLSPKFTNLVEAMLAQQWMKRSTEAVQAYYNFTIDLLVAHNKYAHFLVPRLITLWIPADADAELWPNGTPNEEKAKELKAVQHLLERIVTVIPMTFDLILEIVDNNFPYFKKAPHIIAGYVHNLIWLMEYQPLFTEFIMQILLQKLLILDVNAPRNEIEDAECVEEEDDEWEEEEEDAEVETDTRSTADEEKKNNLEGNDENAKEIEDDFKDDTPLNHPIAHTLDLCMEKIFGYLDTQNPNSTNKVVEEDKKKTNLLLNQFFKLMCNSFDNVLLPCHNSHHVQFLMFYYCSFKESYAEAFLASLMAKVRDPNASVIIRQNSVGYMASFLARAKCLPMNILMNYIKELCDWAHQYVERCDQYRSNGLLKANIVFFSVCQAIFYVIAFRSRVLTVDKKGLLYLQSLRLSALVTCNFNPLRYCLPAVATAFAGVTRAHQLAYCHAVLERNARRKLATVYTNGTETAEDTLDIFFPFDPYLLKFSNLRIQPIYLQYHPSEAEEHSPKTTENERLKAGTRRKRMDSEMFDGEDMDDFLLAEKRRRTFSKNMEKENQYNSFGMSTGFQM